MNNFFNQESSKNKNPYYPEDLSFNVETQNFSRHADTPQSSAQKTNQNPLFNLLGNQNSDSNLFTSLLGNNNILSTLLANNLLSGNSQKNNLLMQTLTNMLSTSKKTSSVCEEFTEKTIESDDFEEM